MKANHDVLVGTVQLSIKPCTGQASHTGTRVLSDAACPSLAQLTFGTVVVPVQIAILWLPLPPHNVVTQVTIGQSWGVPLHNQLGRGVGRGKNV